MQHIELKNKTIFVTGSAGFIGSNLILELLKTQSPVNIIGLDNMNNYYDVSIKEWRLKEIEKCLAQHNDSTYKFYRGDLADKALIDQIFAEHKPHIVVNLAAQAGVRYSITNPDAYIQSNLIGFYNIIQPASKIFGNPAVILMTMDRAVWNIWYMPLPLLYMEQIKKFLTAQMIKWIIQFLYTLQQRKVMN